jgi:hypothetical protein
MTNHRTDGHRQLLTDRQPRFIRRAALSRATTMTSRGGRAMNKEAFRWTMLTA